MNRGWRFALAAFVSAGPLPAQSPSTAGFVTRLGNDTIAVERFTFDGRQLEGTGVVCEPPHR